MAKSVLDDRFEKGDVLIKQIREEQLERLRRVDDLWSSTVADWEDLAKAEDSVRREYGGRYLLELLQNAHDAIIDEFLAHDDKDGFPGWKYVHFELTEQSLLIANCGMPFRDDNIRSICRLHHTTKSTSKQIGHKGIGFKSVLEITETPEVYSDCYAFGFNRQEFASQASKIVGDFSLSQTSLPVLRAPYKRRLSWLSPGERDRIEDLFQEGYVTVIRLPLKSRALLKAVASRMREELRPELLIFLDYVDKLAICYPSGREVEYSKEIRSKNVDGSQEVLLWAREAGELHIKSRWLKLRTREIRIDDRELVQDLGDAWQEVRAVRCGVAFPLTSERALDVESDVQRFHVYFPTEESSGLRFLVNADFYIEAARKDVRRNPLNDHLAEELALYIAIEGTKTLKEQFPRDPAPVEMLAPMHCPDRKFGAFFHEQYLSALSASAFVPLVGGQYKIPSEIRLTPKGSDAGKFREFLPPSQLRGQASWAFPVLKVEKQELVRQEQGRPFLLLDEMGAKRLDVEDTLDVLRDGTPIPRDKQGEFLRFLAHWWNDLPSGERKQMVDALSECAIVATQSGWRNPSDTLVFQANLREEEDIEVPQGFDFEIVPLEVYGEERSYRGVPARFLEEVGVSPYQARDILRRAILPVLTSPARFKSLIEQYPGAIYSAYAFLKEYWQLGRTVSGLEEDLSRVPVPVCRLKDCSEREWKPASEVYFSEYWTGSDDLEIVYGLFEDSEFLGPVDELDIQDKASKQEWYSFFAWLGVSDTPRILEEVGSRWQYSYGEAKSSHPFRDRPLWDEYLTEYQDAFICTNPRKNHGRTRWMARNWALDRFEEIVAQAHGDVALLMRVFRLVGRYWEEYGQCLSTRLPCRYKTECEAGTIPSYLAYCLQHFAWVPAVRWEHMAQVPFRPGDVWNLGVDVRPEVRDMLPSLPDRFQGPEYRGIRIDLLKTEVAFEDYVDLLRRLPDLCPLRPSELTDKALKKWQDATRAVFNWLGQALQNSLIRQGREHWLQRPEDLQLLAYKGEEPYYVSVDKPELVYPDDPFLAEEWEDEMFYLRIDRSWQTFREWLGVSKLSERIRRDIKPSQDLEDATQKVRKQFEEALPYFLGIVSEQQNSRLDQVLARMRRLDVHVVDELIMEQALADSEIPPKSIEENIYLMPRDAPNPRGGRPVRAGDLYITRDEIDNPYIVGDPVATYIEIEGLSDSFIVLYGQKDSRERMRYLESRGVGEEQVHQVAQQLLIPLGEDIFSHKYEELATVFKEHESVSITLPEPSEPGTSSTGGDPSLSSRTPEPSLDSEEKPGEAAPGAPLEPEQELRKMPPLDLEGELCTMTFEKLETIPETTKGIAKPGHSVGGSGRRTIWMPSEEERERLGKRGEKWAYACECRRLKNLGLDPEALEREGKLEWVSRKEKYAPYDIRSVDRIDGRLEEIYIEVKSTTGHNRTVRWPISEFRMAHSADDRYWLYWIGHVDRERPDPPVRYQNPVQLWEEGYIQLGFRQLEITLPEGLDVKHK
jgi:hypothetical protein